MAASPDMTPTPDNPGIRVYAPGWPSAPAPQADYVCRCGVSDAAIGSSAVLALVTAFFATHKQHMDGAR